MGELTRAEALYARAVTVYEKALGPDTLHATDALVGLGLTDVRLGRLEAAAPLIERAVAMNEKAFGSAHPNLSWPLYGLGELYLARGEPSRSVPVLERALTLANVSTKSLIRLTLAEALYRLGKDRPRALALAEEARAEYARIDHKPGIERATRWLREHPVTTAASPPTPAAP
jgi:eukaryotic-like serine/threonine-protein kinase